ncbi:hypothetical protein [Dysgonomonas sp. HGC4]|uniref:hypothetical protein n=1 Tax=Dysgonomonas sp. HGC4 TaxID=1658009 RepID=UPI000681F843|nr:hypothetical protein [Dysgonomonas sp. HGC4]MBD8347836.1 hypothetical protein [Dysgonomonas sp. HGC4]
MKIIILYILLLSPCCIFSQIGINTESPTATLDIKSESTTMPVVLSRNSANTELSRLLDNGYWGLARTNPAVKVDLRGSLGNGELGLGTTAMTAAAAGAGAIRYNNGVEYSDGNTWLRLAVLPTKAYAIAKNEVALDMTTTGATSVNIWTNWTEVEDLANSFNPVTGVFIAPRTGVYAVSCTAMFENVVLISGLSLIHLELIFTVNGLTNDPIASKSTFSAPASSGIPFNATLVNKAFLYLVAGDNLSVLIYSNNRQSQIKTTTDGSYNILTISEM